MAVSITVVFSSDKPLVNKLAMKALDEINDLMVDGESDIGDIQVKLAEFLDYAEVLDGEEEVTQGA